MTAALGTVEIDIDLRVHHLARRLEDALREPARKAARDVEREFERAGHRAGRVFFSRSGAYVDRLGRVARRSLSRSIEKFDDEVSDAATRARRALEEATRDEARIRVDADIRKAQERIRELEKQRAEAKVNVDVDLAAARARLHTLTASKEVLALDVDTRGVDEARHKIDDLADRSARARRVLGGVVVQGAKFTLIGAAAGSALAGVSALTTGALGLVAAIGQAAGTAGLIPSALAGIAAGAATVKTALSGVGDALESLDDPDELAEAMERLAPAAREFVAAVQRARPAVDALRLDVQQRAFEGIGDALDDLAGNYLPRAQRLFRSIAQEMNRAARTSADYLNSQQALQRTDRMVVNLARAWGGLADAAQPAVQAMLDISTTGSDYLPRLSDRVNELSRRFAVFIREAEQSGRLAQYFEDSLDTASQLGRVVRNVGQGIANTFGAAEASGAGLLDRIEQITEAFAAWTGSEHGQDVLGGFFESMQQVSTAVMPVIGALVEAIATDLAPVLADITTNLGPGMADFVRGLGEAITAAGPGVASFARALGSVLSTVAPLLDDVGAAIGFIGDVIAKLADWVRPVVDAFIEFNDSLDGIPAQLIAITGGVVALQRAFSAASLSSMFRGFSRNTKKELDAAGREIDRAGRDAGKKGESFGSRLSRGVGKGIAAFPIVGSIAAVLDETVTLTDQKTGEMVGLVEATTLGLGRAWDALGDLFTGTTTTIRGEAVATSEYYSHSLGEMVRSTVDNLTVMGSAWDQFFGGQSTMAKERAGELAEAVTQGLTQARAAALSVWGGIAEDTNTATASMATAVDAAMRAMGISMTTSMTGIATTTRSAWSDIFGTTVSSSQSTADAVSRAMETARSVFDGGMSAMVSRNRSGWSSMVSETRSGTTRVVDSTGTLKSRILSTLDGLSSGMRSTGQSAVDGLAGGLRAYAERAAVAAREVAARAIAAARAVFDSRSPSRVMMRLGEDVGAGLVIGLQRSQVAVSRAAVQLAQSTVDGFAGAGTADPFRAVWPFPTAAASARARGGGDVMQPGRSVTVHQTITTPAADPRAVAAAVDARLRAAVLRVG